MKMNHDWINFPLAVAWMSSGYWLQLFENGSWFFGTLLPYIGVAVGGMQLYFLFRKWQRRNQ